MFFMIGITEGKKEFGHNQVMICGRCGAYGRYTVFMTYTVLSLFFIPCFKWNRQYYVRTTCCGTVYRLDSEIGRRIERGEDVEIRVEHLQTAGNWSSGQQRAGQEEAGNWSAGRQTAGREATENRSAGRQQAGPGVLRCGNCGYTTEENFVYCPKCGRRF